MNLKTCQYKLSKLKYRAKKPLKNPIKKEIGYPRHGTANIKLPNKSVTGFPGEERRGQKKTFEELMTEIKKKYDIIPEIQKAQKH